ncbi:MAG: hypothetical protein P0S94_03615 [Simkaniaceae bacterium]|nr:hypothetical protein [Simkaniaceae bacterium]
MSAINPFAPPENYTLYGTAQYYAGRVITAIFLRIWKEAPDYLLLAVKSLKEGEVSYYAEGMLASIAAYGNYADCSASAYKAANAPLQITLFKIECARANVFGTSALSALKSLIKNYPNQKIENAGEHPAAINLGRSGYKPLWMDDLDIAVWKDEETRTAIEYLLRMLPIEDLPYTFFKKALCETPAPEMITGSLAVSEKLKALLATERLTPDEKLKILEIKIERSSKTQKIEILASKLKAAKADLSWVDQITTSSSLLDALKAY